MTNKEKQIFIEEMEVRALSEDTVRAYLSSLKGFFTFHRSKNKTAKQLCVPEIKDYQRDLIKKHYAPNTINRHLSAIRMFYRFVYNRDYKEDIPRVEAPRIQPVILSREEVQKLISSVHKIFYKSVLMTLYSTGMRSSELRNLKVTDIDRDREVITIKNAKGKKDRQAFLSPVTYKYLCEYWRKDRLKNKTDSDYVFMPTKNSYAGEFKESLSHSALGYIVNIATKAAGIKKKFPLIPSGTALLFIF